MQNEGRKILHLPDLKVSCTCVRVPVVRSHSVSIVVRTKEKISVEQARAAIAQAAGCRLVDDLGSKRYPMPNAGKVALAGGDLFMPGSRADYNRCLAMLRQGMLPRYQLELNATRVVHMARKLTEEEQKTKE